MADLDGTTGVITYTGFEGRYLGTSTSGTTSALLPVAFVDTPEVFPALSSPEIPLVQWTDRGSVPKRAGA